MTEDNNFRGWINKSHSLRRTRTGFYKKHYDENPEKYRKKSRDWYKRKGSLKLKILRNFRLFLEGID